MIKMTMPQFETWSHDNLAKFAHDAYAKMQEQDDRIQQLQCELKDALAAYRAVLRTSEGRPLDEPSPSQTSASSAASSRKLTFVQGTGAEVRQELARQWPLGSSGQ